MSCTRPEWKKKIDRYVLGEMSGEELSGFEKHYFACDECAGEVRLAEEMADAARRLGPGMMNVPEAEGPRPASVGPPHPARFRPRRRLVPILVAAVILVLLGLRVFLPGAAPSIEEIARVSPPLYVAPDVRGEGREEGEKIFREGMTLFREGRYVDAAARLEDLLRVDPEFEELDYHLGLAYLFADRPTLAAGALRRAAARGPRDERPRWYLAHALLREGEIDEALDEFARVARMGGSRAAKAEEKRKAIERLRRRK